MFACVSERKYVLIRMADKKKYTKVFGFIYWNAAVHQDVHTVFVLNIYEHTGDCMALYLKEISKSGA